VPPSKYRVAFHAQMPCAPKTATFRFGKPTGYEFTPGQYFSLTLDTREGPQTKSFSHCESPQDPYIELTTRLTGSAFKDALLALSPHQEVEIAGPNGRLVVPPGVSRVGFLVGGVGITPARSIIRDAVQRRTGLDVLAFYGNLDQSCIPFKEEFDAYEAALPAIRFVHVLQEPLSGWDGESGFITAAVVLRHCDPLDGRFWISAGPPAMAEAMRKVKDELGIPDDHFALELFSGYA
jgi:glycine betaine catabolism B